MTLPRTSLELWAACALPGDGPEYRFTATRPRTSLRGLWSLLRSRRKAAR